jgi:hypothetical protein
MLLFDHAATHRVIISTRFVIEVRNRSETRPSIAHHHVEHLERLSGVGQAIEKKKFLGSLTPPPQTPPLGNCFLTGVAQLCSTLEHIAKDGT